ncbi:MAG: hypothetical protein AB1757_30250 [Acidobacteriota bacterium]
MKTLKEYALAAWAEAQSKYQQAELKKRKRRAQKIESALEKLLPKAAASYQLERRLEDSEFTVVVIATSTDGSLKFTLNAKGELALIGDCPNHQRAALSPPIESLADLGRLIEHFEPDEAQDCEPV